jgi:antitoxin component YwqK of YwqJK toxin-antitoxin module
MNCIKEKDFDYYGEFTSSYNSDEFVMEIMLNNQFMVSVTHSISEDMIITRTVSNGNIHFNRNVIEFMEEKTNVVFYGKIQSDTLELFGERVTILDDNKEILIPNRFYCFVRLYNNGLVRYSGSWSNGRKSGQWIYFDQNGTIIETKTYE